LRFTTAAAARASSSLGSSTGFGAVSFASATPPFYRSIGSTFYRVNAESLHSGQS
jgi:hypothetical protein